MNIYFCFSVIVIIILSEKLSVRQSVSMPVYISACHDIASSSQIHLNFQMRSHIFITESIRRSDDPSVGPSVRHSATL